jgi:structural maintenance of chromosome 4
MLLANEERGEKLNRVKLVEKEKGNLEGAKNEAEEYLKQEREIIDKRSILYQIYRCQRLLWCLFHRNESDVVVGEIVAKKEEAEAKLKAEKDKARESHDSLAEGEATLKRERKLRETIEKDMVKAKSDFAGNERYCWVMCTVYERKDIKFREDIKHLKNKEKKLAASIAQEAKKIKDKTISLGEAEQDIERYWFFLQ